MSLDIQQWYALLIPLAATLVTLHVRGPSHPVVLYIHLDLTLWGEGGCTHVHAWL